MDEREALRELLEEQAALRRVATLVADDGAGGADPAAGSGLRGLRDRVEALGGTLAVESPSGGGTTVSAELPWEPTT